MAIDLEDKSPNSNNLTNTGGAEYTADSPFGTSSISVDLEQSEADFLSAPDHASFPTGDISGECWVKLEQLPSTLGKNMFFMSQVRANALNKGWDFGLSGDKLDVFWFGAGTTTSKEESDAVAVVGGDVGNWVHFAFTLDVSAKDCKLYKNGSLIASTLTDGGHTAFGNPDARFAIGVYYADISNPADVHLDGIIDEVRIWDDVRTASEIDDNKALELVGSEAGLVAYYPFESLVAPPGIPGYKNLLGVGR